MYIKDLPYDLQHAGVDDSFYFYGADCQDNCAYPAFGQANFHTDRPWMSHSWQSKTEITNWGHNYYNVPSDIGYTISFENREFTELTEDERIMINDYPLFCDEGELTDPDDFCSSTDD